MKELDMEGNLEEGLDCKRDPGCSTSGQGELQELVSASSSSPELVGSFPREAFAAPGVGFSCPTPVYWCLHPSWPFSTVTGSKAMKVPPSPEPGVDIRG